MPIRIPEALPAHDALTRENIFVMDMKRAITQDIRALRIVILILMTATATTETQLLRRLSNTPLQIDVDLLQTSTYTPTHVSTEHLLSFYRTFDEIKENRYDGMIITGAPVEHMPFEEVAYWDELCEIMDWSRRNVFSTFHICWGAQAGLYHHYGLKKYQLPKKMFGVFAHNVIDPLCPLFRGFDDVFYAPHSRHTEVRLEDVMSVPELEVLSVSNEAGLYACISRDGRQVFVTGHSEYDAETLANEYFRDKNQGLPIELPKNYFPGDDPRNTPRVTWRGASQLLYTNWLNYYVYQATPYDLDEL